MRLHDMCRQRPLVMGILNVTPDSFSDGGLHVGEAARRRMEAMLLEGVDIIDIGGESTRPGHAQVSVEEELRRVVPAVEAAVAAVDGTRCLVSVDTRKAAVAAPCIAAGVHIVNDVSGLADPAMGPLVADADVDLVLMRNRPIEGDLVDGCRQQLRQIVDVAELAGIPEGCIVVDPGLGFGDPPGGDPLANLRLVDAVRAYADGLPVLVGASRKRFIGTLSGEDEAARRVGGSVAVALRAVAAGASIVRVHDVRETVQALRVWLS